MKNIVVIGGGTGLSSMLMGMKSIQNANITAIVTVADDGGSTGRIRDIYKSGISVMCSVPWHRMMKIICSAI